jgi:small subunit ribosomal protein S6
MTCYEITFIARAALPKAELDKLTQSFIDIITNGGGKLIKQEYWGLRPLAYPIQKSNKGHYTLLGIETASEALFELERNFRLNEDIVRNLTVRVENMDDTPSVMMREPSERDSRDSRHSRPRPSSRDAA